MERLKITIVKGVMYAKIKFWSITDNDYYTMLALIDTGAAITTFSESAVKRLGYLHGREVNNIRTAGGITNSHEVKIPKLKINSLEFTDVNAHSNKCLNDIEIDCILGMNVLMQFNFNINFEYNLITLEKRSIH